MGMDDLVGGIDVPAWQLYPLLHISDLRAPMCTGNHAIWEVVVIEMEAKQ